METKPCLLGARFDSADFTGLVQSLGILLD